MVKRSGAEWYSGAGREVHGVGGAAVEARQQQVDGVGAADGGARQRGLDALGTSGRARRVSMSRPSVRSSASGVSGCAAMASS